MSEPAPFKYRAFLSYSHRDRAWCKWLHGALEGFRVDKDLVGRATPVGPVPKTLRPIFRDREDFSAGHSLTAQTASALDASQFMVVLCSPNAARSAYVNEEIRRFKALGRGERIIPLIVDGEPGHPDNECFPPALRFALAPDGTLSEEREEPIAADARPQGDGKELAKLKAIAGLLGLGLDEIVRRAEKARRRRSRILAALAGVFLMLAVSATGGFAWARYELSRNEALLDRTLARATALVERAVAMSDRLGVPRSVSVGILEEAEGMFRDMAELGRETPALRYRKAHMLLTFADNYHILGRTNEALDRARQSRDLLLVLTKEDSDNEEWQLSLALAHGVVAELLGHRRDLAGALTELRAARAIAERAIADDPEDAAWHTLLFRVRLGIGDMLAVQGKVKDATASYRNAIAGVERLAKALSTDLKTLFDRNPDMQPVALGAVNRLASLLALQGNFADALTYFQTALQARERILAADPQSLNKRDEVLDSRYRIANLQLDLGNLDAAMAQYQSGYDATAKVVADDPKNVGARRTLALFRDGIGRTQLAGGRADEALATFRDNLTRAKPFIEADPGNLVWRGHLATGHDRVGRALEAKSDLAGAMAEYRTAFDIVSGLVAHNPEEVDWRHQLGVAHLRIGEVLRRQGAHDSARKHFADAEPILRKITETNPDIVLFRIDHLQARWRLAGDAGVDSDVVATLRALRDKKQMSMEKLTWLAEAERELESAKAQAR